MNTKPIDYYFKRLNQVPPRMREILFAIRSIDKQVAKKQILIDQKREKFLEKLVYYQQNKYEQRSQARPKLIKRNKSMLKKDKVNQKNRQGEKSFSSSNRDLQNGGTQLHINRQIKNPKLKSQLTEQFKSINRLNNKIIQMTKQKIELSEQLYNCIDEPTQEIERNISKFMPCDEEKNRKGFKSRRNKKDNGEDYVESEPKYCYCRRPSYGLMVECSNEKCINQWFHTQCIDQKYRSLKQQWFCRDCRNQVKTRNS